MDVYMTMNLPSGELMSFQLVDTDYIEAHHVKKLLDDTHAKGGQWPKEIIIRKDDPAQALLTQICTNHNISLQSLPESYLEDLTAPVKQSYGRSIFSPSSMLHSAAEDHEDEADLQAARQMIPDAYDPCWCASGKKFRFCCKPIFREMIGAMTSAQEGHLKEALDHIAAAKKINGETAEILCRESIVMSMFGRSEAHALLERALAVDPNHPRANYIRGINLKESGNYRDAIEAYKCAIKSYPQTDRYHLNETYNNLGTAYYQLNDYQNAKDAWEKALVLLPSDKTVKRNLRECIYENPEIPASIRIISPFVLKYFNRIR